MARSLAKILANLRAFRPARGNWMRLDALLVELWEGGFYADAVDDLFAVFERFPGEDGAGVFWTILHGLESLPDYERALVASVRRRPSEFGVLMVKRLLNGGQTQGEDVPLLGLLESVAARADVPESIRQSARDFAKEHGGAETPGAKAGRRRR
jgi:hypothetical protein